VDRADRVARTTAWTDARFKRRAARADAVGVTDDFAVRCRGCGFTWNTAAMAEGLRVLGSCPKCAGALEFGARAKGGTSAASDTAPTAAAPHLVLGVPRR
jgi:hypothetical protein